MRACDFRSNGDRYAKIPTIGAAGPAGSPWFSLVSSSVLLPGHTSHARQDEPTEARRRGLSSHGVIRAPRPVRSG